jgi:electron transfer flavoprotein alpha subunit
MKMETVLFLCPVDADGTLPKAGLEALTAARGLAEGGTLVAGLFGADVGAAANAIAGCGAKRFLGVSGADFAASRYATDAAAAEALVKASGATVVVAPATSRTARTLPGVAHRVGGRVDTHVTGLAADGSITRWYYRQRMEATFTRAHRPWMLLVDAGTQPAWSGASGPAAVEAVAVAAPASRTKVQGVRAPASDQQTIRPDAKLLFVAGAGWTKKQADGKPHPEDAEKHILGFLRASGASLGSSKSLVDQGGEGNAVLGFMSHLNQVGQTGSTPRHPKGLATCCHGEEPHVVGWRFINERRAVNLDANCGWARGKADVLYVADAFAVMAKVNELLGK